MDHIHSHFEVDWLSFSYDWDDILIIVLNKPNLKNFIKEKKVLNKRNGSKKIFPNTYLNWKINKLNILGNLSLKLPRRIENKCFMRLCSLENISMKTTNILDPGLRMECLTTTQEH